MRKRHLIKIQEDTSNPTDESETWSTFRDDVPALVQDVTGNEGLRGYKIDADVQLTAEVRYIPHIDNSPRWRVTYDSRTFNIRAVLDKKGDRREQLILLSEIK